MIDFMLGIMVGIGASWLLGFLLVDRETMRELELQNEKSKDTRTT